jgi:hypothetical protein
MAEKTSEQLQAEAAKQAALAAKSKAAVDLEKVKLRQQQSDLRNLQASVVEFGQKSVGATPSQQQIYATAIISATQKINTLKSITIPSTNNKINSLSTETVNYEENAKSLEAQAQAAIQGPPVPPPVSEATEPTNIAPVRDIPEFPGEADSGNSPIEVNIAAPLQSTSIVVPDPNEIQGPLAPQAQRQPTVQIFDDGSTLTTNADGTFVPTDATEIISSPQSSTILDGLGGLAAGAAAGLIGGALLRKAPESIRGAVGAAAITGAVGLATNALFGNSIKGLTTNKKATQAAQSNQDARNQQSTADWRVRLSLADPDQNYLYNLKPDPGILAPLRATNGVIFPYVPSVSVSYIASYDPTDVTHSNYKIYSYRQSSVESISLTCDFTAQDTNEANYLLAVIHFFRSVTKMFYGKDENPKPGTPPPLCYLTGLGAFQFDKHPLVITNFTYTLPTEVDYIRASYYTSDEPGVSQAPNNTFSQPGPREVRLPQYLKAGGVQGPPQWKTAFPSSVEPTYVPTKMQIQVQALPVVTRNDISRRFSLAGYASGDFYRGSAGKTNGRGIW